MDDHRELATALVEALLPDSDSCSGCLDGAIRIELLITALDYAAIPRTLTDLLRVLDHISAGEVARELVSVVRERAKKEPSLLLAELAADGP